MLRYTAGGLLDTTFGRGGTLVLDVGGRNGEVTATALQPDGRLVVVGWARTGADAAPDHRDLIIGRVIPVSGAGTVWTWGWNAMGQLGDGSNAHPAVPGQVMNLSGVVSVSAGAITPSRCAATGRSGHGAGTRSGSWVTGRRSTAPGRSACRA
ncbi:MAG: hypothetical protein M3163_05805 [Actinomycetota bacterium]|nr:hypothetical protein [Actinomycetota bacterium]